MSVFVLGAITTQHRQNKSLSVLRLQDTCLSQVMPVCLRSLCACCLCSEVDSGGAARGGGRSGAWRLLSALSSDNESESKHLHCKTRSKAHKPQGIFQYGRCFGRDLKHTKRQNVLYRTHTHTHIEELRACFL